MVDRSVAVRRKAQQLLQKGDVNGALAEYEKLFEGGDKDPYDFIVVADLLAKRGSMQEAVRRYRQAIEEYAKTELYKNAIAVCKKILRISKEDLAIHRTLGELYAKEGLYGDAQIHYLEFALRADQPERGGRELLRRAERAKLLGRLEEAEAIRERVSTLAPSLLQSFHAAPVSAAGPVAAAAAAAAADAAEARGVPAGQSAPPAQSGFEPSSRAIEREMAAPAEPTRAEP